MKRNILTFIVFSFIFLFFSLSVCEVSSAFWLWTPKDKKFINPKYAVKDTPEEQYEWAMRFYREKDFKRAAEEFVRLTQAYKDADVAPEAQYYAGRSFEEQGKYWFAYENYQKTIDNYPYTKRLQEVIEREFRIANILQTKESPRLMDMELNLALDRAVTIYKKIIDNSAFGEYADKSLYKMADCYRRMRKYSEAVDAYEKLITDYPNSPLVAEAKYQIAYTMYEASLDPDYDQESTDEALEKFQKIVKTTAIPTISEQADKAIDVLRARKADSLLNIAEFYEKQGKYRSAVIYYQDISAKYPETSAAMQANYKITALQARIAR